MRVTPASRLAFVLIPLLALALVAGCASNKVRDQQRLAKLTPEKLYERGQKSLRASDYQDAVQVYEAMMARYPFALESRQARLDIIFAYYRMGEKESAKDAAETFIRENPTHPRVDYAWYLKGLIDFERTPYTVERWLRVDLTERAPLTAKDAFQSLRTVVTRYPKSIYAADARRRMIYLRNRLAGYEMQVAHHYMERQAWVAAAQRARQTVEQYDGAPAAKEALQVMYLCYRKLDYKELAENTEKVFHENFPNDAIEPRGATGGSWWKFWRAG
jgi:outer membrane protein assembly factor BamD